MEEKCIAVNGKRSVLLSMEREAQRGRPRMFHRHQLLLFLITKYMCLDDDTTCYMIDVLGYTFLTG